jgi:hypothetical protein
VPAKRDNGFFLLAQQLLHISAAMLMFNMDHASDRE